MMSDTQYWVIKVGSSVLGGSGDINLDFIIRLTEQIKKQNDKNQKIVLVTSGAISQGMKVMGLKKRPTSMAKLQALASIGQIKIITTITENLNRFGINAAQILLTAEDLGNRVRYVNARNTFKSLLDQGVIPIVNENDTISIQSIRFGDNDTLAALVANLISAHYLLILTDIDGLFDKNPKKFDDAKLIRLVDSNSPDLNEIKGLDAKSEISSGGMKTKINAVKTAAQSGTHTIIASGFNVQTLENVFENPKSVGSFFRASVSKEKSRKLWLGYALKPKGKIEVNLRAAKALEANASLLAVGIVGIFGSFEKGDMVEIIYKSNAQEVEIARGISSLNSIEIEKIKGMNSENITKQFNMPEKEVIHRDNMLITAKLSKSSTINPL